MDGSFRSNVGQSLRRFSRHEPADEATTRFLQAFRYCALDIDREEDYRRPLTLVEQREAELGISANRLNMYHSIRVHPNHPVSRYLLQFTCTEPAHDADEFRRREGREILDILSGIRYKSIADPDPDRPIALIREAYQDVLIGKCAVRLPGRVSCSVERG